MQKIPQDQLNFRHYACAALAAEMQTHGVCASKHHFDYAHGWYYINDVAQQRPSTTKAAREAWRMKRPIGIVHDNFVFCD